MSDLYERIEKVCKGNEMTITSMCKASGASRASLSDLKMGRKQGLSTDTLAKIAKVLGVSVGLLIGEKPEWEAAILEYGFCWDQIYREEKKAVARAVIDDPTATIEEKIKAQTVVFKSLFSRSLEAFGYDLAHPDFPVYVSMILNQGKGGHGIPAEVYDAMVKQYGSMPGIARGTYYSTENQQAPALTKKDERDIAKDLELVMENLANAEGLMFDGNPMSDEARESMRAAIELGLKTVKLLNKETYTPKKYKKG